MWTRRHLRRARIAARAGDWQRAARHYRAWLEARPGDKAAWVQLGHALKEGNELRGARHAYEQATIVAPDDADAWFQLGNARRLLGDRCGAVAAIRAAVQAQPSFGAAIEELIGLGEREQLPDRVQRAMEEGGTPVFARSRVMAWREARSLPEPPRSGEDVTADVSAGPRSAGGSLSPRLVVRDGAVLDELATAWFAFAAARVDADMIYCDHLADEQEPWLQPMPDPLWFADPATLPAAILVREGIADDADLHGMFLAAMARGRVAHLPLPLVHTHAIRSGSVAAASDGRDAHIQVVIQTRDAATLLAPCVETLLKTAARPDLLDVVIVDNRSTEPATEALFSHLMSDGSARILPLDEEFNWSRANNLAAACSDAPLLLFLNNDTESLTTAWDHRLRDNLADPGIGMVGARLLYPDGSIQHAGIVFGMNAGDPIHEGIPEAEDTAGPMMRWCRRRSVPAVTGAWAAMRRETFSAVGGFDERLAVAFNDVDLCLRVRASGLRILYDPSIEALHRESMTRGAFLDGTALARDRAEAAYVHARWGEALRFDPGYNPGWTRSGRPFDGLRVAKVEEVVAWLDRSAAGDPWKVPAPHDQFER